VDSSGAGQGDVRVEAQSPGGRIQNLSAVYRHGQYVINFSEHTSLSHEGSAKTVLTVLLLALVKIWVESVEK
jgi:hypothetical protein